MTETTDGKQGSHLWGKGQSGNPAGRPKGARHRVTVLAEKLMSDDAEDVLKAVIDAAKGGDMTAARLVLDRICPPRRGASVAFDLPPLTAAADAPKAMAAIVAAVAFGDLSPAEAADLAGLVEKFTKAIETAELAARLAVIEKQIGNRK